MLTIYLMVRCIKAPVRFVADMSVEALIHLPSVFNIRLFQILPDWQSGRGTAAVPVVRCGGCC